MRLRSKEEAIRIINNYALEYNQNLANKTRLDSVGILTPPLNLSRVHPGAYALLSKSMIWRTAAMQGLPKRARRMS